MEVPLQRLWRRASPKTTPQALLHQNPKQIMKPQARGLATRASQAQEKCNAHRQKLLQNMQQRARTNRLTILFANSETIMSLRDHTD